MSDLVEYSEIIDAFRSLPLYVRGSNWHRAACPIHAGGHEKNPSLYLSESTGILQCGVCGPSGFGAIMRALREMGAPAMRRDEPVPMRRASKRKEPVFRDVETYNYTTIDGELVGIKTRCESSTLTERGKHLKKFRWEAPSGGTLADAGLSIADMPLYRVGDLAGVEPGSKRVFIVEGERCCDALRARNELAVSGAGSASSLPSMEALEPLRGFDVICWRDNDEPGLKYAETLKGMLRYTAKSVKIIVAPGNPADDAIEYFHAGGQVDDLLSLTEPLTERLAADRIRVTMPMEVGPVVFDAEEMYTPKQGETWAELTIRPAMPGLDNYPHSQRLNLISASSVRDLANLMGKLYPALSAKEWFTTVHQATDLIKDEYKQTGRAERYTFMPDGRPPRVFVVDDILPEGQHSILFAPPATGKSYSVLGMALAVAMGAPFADHETTQTPVIYLDYEMEQADFDERLERLYVGMGLDPITLSDIPIYRIPGNGVILADQVAAVKREMRDVGAGLLVIDSIGYAVGGDLFDPAAAMRYFAALQRMGITTLSIGQAPAGNAEKLFGSVFFEYGPHGRIWSIFNNSEPGASQMDIGWACRKASQKWPKPWAMHLTLEGDDGPVTIRSQEFGEVAAFESYLADGDRIARWFAEQNGGSYKVIDVANNMGIPAERVKAALDAGKGGRFALVRPQRQGDPWKWALRASGE